MTMSNTMNASHVALQHFLNTSGETITAHLANNITQSTNIIEIFPLKTDNELDDFEQKLLFDKKFRLDMVCLLFLN